MVTEGFYRRPLPPPSISFASPQGRQIFQEAIALGGMEGYFPLAEQFHTQSEPAFCGLGTLVMVLNALSIDPGRIWKGVWRWYGEEFLECCQPLSAVKNQGITFDEFVCLARCNGAKVQPYRYDQSNLQEFRNAVKQATFLSQGLHLVVCYSRQVVGQTGDGHFSPVGGYHPERDLVLLLDVARFKYPPHWVPLTVLWNALQPIDPATGKCRGYMLISNKNISSQNFFHVGVDIHQWAMVAPYFKDIAPTLLAQEQPDSLFVLLDVLLRNLPLELTSVLCITGDNLSTEFFEIWCCLLEEIKSHPLWTVTQNALLTRNYSETSVIGKWQLQEKNLTYLLTMFLLSCPEEIYQPLNERLLSQIYQLREVDRLPPLMRQEVVSLKEQMLALQNLFQTLSN
ncbi:phytochelatin synthase [Nostoc punctiforme FACHB-252]|uniref:glutathione gamma-glutamylcysteinyltransferase n=1 Tax=Nostoc punctiforme FACHB-252 TaxID=1357509 RepID=A0ABR8HEW2_NOSPU|nr:phytochelatin synthase family protein [Nostoc punctiforme]MBD2613927.1 phytochelatin synthase [Nostoc punctiforme FACHB-252]